MVSSFIRRRRFWLVLMLAACLGAPRAGAGEDRETVWDVGPSPGMDAILLLGAVSGDVMQADIYAETIAFVRSRLSPEALAALGRIDQTLRVEHKQLTGPGLAYFFSAGPLDSIDDVIASALAPDRLLRPTLEKSSSWNEDRYEDAQRLMPDVVTVLRGLKEIGIEEWYAGTVLPRIREAVERIKPEVSPYDVIPEQARLLGRELDPTIGILVVRFSDPYGIRIVGQRFIISYGTPGETVLRVAAHEIFHPPFDLSDRSLVRRLRALERDPWVRSIVENHDAKFGYNSFKGLINEDSTQALDQIVSERLGFGRDPATRWVKSDDGMHMIAAALYQAMMEDGFAASGGVYSDWLKSALDRGLLTPDEVRRRAALIVGPEPVQRWTDIAERR